MKRFWFAVPLITLFCTGTAFVEFIETSSVLANKKQVPLTVLENGEKTFNDAIFIRDAFLASINDVQSIYVLDIAKGLFASNSDRLLGSRKIASHVQNPTSIAADSKGNLYIADSEANQVAIVNLYGQVIKKFSIARPQSLAVLSNGNMVIASPSNNNLLHLYDVEGRRLKSFGRVKRFDEYDTLQNIALNKGKVLVDSADNIYHVSKFALTPNVQKFSPKGKFLSEFEITGKAINIQLEVARRFLTKRTPYMYGGIVIITSAAIDPVTDHLWISMNGSSGSGVVYEYNRKGKKIKEYGFLSDFGQRMPSVEHIIVSSPWIYVFSSGKVYKYNLSSVSIGNVMPQSEQCPDDLQWPESCTTNCGTQQTNDDKDCKASLLAAVEEDCCVVVSKNCDSGTNSCQLSIGLCNTANGEITTHTSSLTCGPSGGGGGSCVDESSSCTQEECDWCDSLGGFLDPETCYCWTSTPIIIDTLGNGFNLTDGSGGIRFDLNANGQIEQVAWTAAGSDDAFLVLDRNANGAIDNGAELFGDVTPQPPSSEPNGFIALAEFDKLGNGGNRDGKIDSRDAIFLSLRLGQDANRNGFSEPNELHTLPSLGLATIDLDYKESRRRDQYGNWFRYRAKVRDTRGAQLGRWAWDVLLVAGR